jgi:hypothetical protein
VQKKTAGYFYAEYNFIGVFFCVENCFLVNVAIDSIIEPIPMTPKELACPEVGSLAYDVAQANKLLFKADF